MIYKCKNCGGNVVYDPETKKMRCKNCDSIDMFDIQEDANAFSCINCGATIEETEDTIAFKCEYCGAYQVLETKITGEKIPHLVLPFQITRKEAEEALRREFKKRFFTPEEFLSARTLEKMEGIYVPFWLYDYKVNLDYEGEGKKVSVTRSGNKETTTTSYYNVVRNLDITFDKLPADASKGMPDDVMDLLEPFHYNNLELFDKKYLSGFLGEGYQYTAEDLKERIKDRVSMDAKTVLRETITGYSSVTPYRNELTYLEEKDQYALLPVYVYEFEFKGKTYKYHINGQTGKVIGETAIDKQKVWLYALSIGFSVFSIGQLLLGILGVM